ncbi:hypothetical protein [Ornithinibacillus sp. JPR2-1]|uniref:hypothetical protein n=1 Tax=Ornithinibacillus sp. JPR2-1 TaxID=2094019 RepID=UPI0031CF3954
MKKIILIIVLLIIVVGCSQQKNAVNFNKNSTLIVEERLGDEFSINYEVINQIQDKDIVQSIIDILRNVKWETNTDISMEHEPDYKLNEFYHIWVTPNGDKLEIINRDNSYYVSLSEQTSSDLFKIITGEDL